MISQLANLNWISVLVAFAGYFILGALWFTLFFSKSYRISLGRENETLQNKPIFIVGPALCSLVITVASAVLIYALNVQSIGDAFKFSLLVGIGYLFANTVNIAINPNIPRPILYGMISGTYHLVGIFFVSVILVLMK
ncbi:DUF1761 domain-containing protein [Chitinophaga ginsengisoli]|uniref:Uncharacterized protein DUF1761 n=1 Tax=Chitinophaga ginsengisoli TaxID=363837 RepID=A0A2P8GH78_9BACT|nr:DUF1761 domain-containing protein [Chitinophaga ginsengisoli]PSL33326.1 uncharacterized protein DUF1761 [Chitinophaga ginsengisoli]